MKMNLLKRIKSFDWDNIVITLVVFLAVAVLTIGIAYTIVTMLNGTYVSTHDKMRAACDKGMGQWVEGSRDDYCIYPPGGGI